jgi:hypothetical protein
MISSEQFGAMHSALEKEGGFTFNPRKDKFETEGFSVATRPEAEHRIPTSETTPGHIEGYAQTHREALSQAPEHLGGWRSDTHDVLDVSKVYPRTGAGETASRYQAVKHNQEATYEMRGAGVPGVEHANPFHAKGDQFPEFSAMAASGRSMSQVMKRAPEIRAWVQGPAGRERSGR